VAEGKQPWDAVFDRVRCVYFADRKYGPKTTAIELDAIEAQLDILFPLSYRAFAERFGVNGSVRGGVRLLPLLPLGEQSGFEESVVTSTQLYRTGAGDPSFDARMEPHSDIGGLVPFAVIDEGPAFAFYSPELTDAKRREYRIYTVHTR
jgi:hypothetical protein